MKRKVTSRADVVGWLHWRAAFVLLLSTFLCTAAFSQKGDSQQEFGDLSSITWKTSTEFTTAISQEQARTDLVLAEPDLPAADRSLFLGYKRLLAYVHADVLAGAPVQDAIEANYLKVLKEATQDPALKQLPENSLSALIPTLVETLAAVPLAAPASAQ